MQLKYASNKSPQNIFPLKTNRSHMHYNLFMKPFRMLKRTSKTERLVKPTYHAYDIRLTSIRL